MIVLSYPTEIASWVPVPKRSHAFTKDDLKTWAVSAAETAIGLRGSGDLETLVLELLQFVPSPEEVDRVVYMPTLGPSMALVEFDVGAIKDGWREALIEGWSQGPAPMRPIEVDEVTLGDLADAFRLVYTSERKGSLVIVMGFAGRIGDQVVSATAYVKHLSVAAELAEAMSVFCSRLELANEAETAHS